MRTSLINLEIKVGVIASQLKATKARLGQIDAGLWGGEEHLELPTQNPWGTVFSNPPSRPSSPMQRESPVGFRSRGCDSLEKSSFVVPGAKFEAV